MKIIYASCLILPMAISSSYADTIKICEDGKPYTEARKDDPTCHDISSILGNSSNKDDKKPPKPIVSDSGSGSAGGGGCGSSSICGQNSYTIEGSEEPPTPQSPNPSSFPQGGSPSVPSSPGGNGGFGSGSGGGGFGGF